MLRGHTTDGEGLGSDFDLSGTTILANSGGLCPNVHPGSADIIGCIRDIAKQQVLGVVAVVVGDVDLVFVWHDEQDRVDSSVSRGLEYS